MFPVIYKVNKHGLFFFMEHIVIVFYFKLLLVFCVQNLYSFCANIRLLMCVVCLSCRATALQTAIECKLLQKLDVINTVHDFVCVCVHICVCVCVCVRARARQSSC